MSAVWKYFEKVETPEGKKGSCLHVDRCSNGKKILIKCAGGSTSGLKKHLRTFHASLFQELTTIEEQAKSQKRKNLEDASSTCSSTKQPKITAAIDNLTKYPLHHPTQEGFDSRFLNVIIEGMLPFNIANLTSTEKLIEFLNRRVTVKHSTTYSNQAEGKYDTLMKKLGTVICSNVHRCLALTTDLWTSRVNESYMSLTLHYITDDFKLNAWTPFCKYIGESHTSDVLSTCLEDMVETFPLEYDRLKLYCVTDNAANIKLAVRKANMINIPCNNHTLQLAIEDTFSDCDGMNDVLQKCKNIASMMHKSAKTEKLLAKYCDKNNHKCKKIHQQNDTRWNSSYENMSDVLYHQTCINDMGNSDELKEELIPSVREWKMIEGACEVLKKLLLTTKEWEKEKVPTLNLVCDELHSINCKLEEFASDSNKKGYGIVFAKKLKSSITKRFPVLGIKTWENAFANILDPTVKGVHLMEKSLFKEGVSKLKEIASELNLCVETVIENGGEGDQQSKKNSIISPLEQLKLKFSSTASEMQNHENKFDEEMKLYTTLPYCEKRESILAWWKNHQESLPILSNLAKMYLAIPAASSKSERVFSCAGSIVTPRRTRLSNAKVEMLVVLNQNFSLIDSL